ncbi:MAG: hypothetical protein ACI4R8_05255 [Candidatus Caccovivens sp.]
MKKKIILGFLVMFLGVSLFGCEKSTLTLMQENISEWTQVYYFGECETFYATLSSGVREKEYLMNGKATENVDFALLTLNFDENPQNSAVSVSLDIDGSSSVIEMELNTLNNTFMIDLEKLLSGDETISVDYEGKNIQLVNVSKDFKINDKQAMVIACKEMENEITKKKHFNNLNAEIYLRILDKKANNFDDLFWCLTVLNVDNESYSIVISTVDGSVLAKTDS